MIALIDADVLRYEVGFSSQFIDEDTGLQTQASWDFVEGLLERRVQEILTATKSTEYKLFITMDGHTKLITTKGETDKYKRNFREAVAVSKPYKSTRKLDKPLHYKNITAYLLSLDNCLVAEGYEADDLMASMQTDNTIICSRDKDLRQVEGMFYSWGCGRQNSFGPVNISKLGRLARLNGKVMGTGTSFFHYQLLIGDAVDNIPGIPRVGEKKAFNLLGDVKDLSEQWELVEGQYMKAFGGDSYKDHIQEQGKLLWLCRGFNNGEPIQWDYDEHKEFISK